MNLQENSKEMYVSADCVLNTIFWNVACGSIHKYSVVGYKSRDKQAVGGRPPRYAPASVRRMLRPNSSPYMHYAWPVAPSVPCFQ